MKTRCLAGLGWVAMLLRRVEAAQDGYRLVGPSGWTFTNPWDGGKADGLVNRGPVATRMRVSGRIWDCNVSGACAMSGAAFLDSAMRGGGVEIRVKSAAIPVSSV
jgi:hypothetical protein